MGAAYGRTLNSTDPAFGTLTDDQAILAQWVALAILQEPGSDWTAPEAGVGLPGLVGKSFTDSQLATEAARAAAAIETDQRIASCDATLSTTFLADGSAALSLVLAITPKDPRLAPFSLTTTASAGVVKTITRGL